MGAKVSKEEIVAIASSSEAYSPPLGPPNPVRILAPRCCGCARLDPCADGPASFNLSYNEGLMSDLTIGNYGLYPLFYSGRITANLAQQVSMAVINCSKKCSYWCRKILWSTLKCNWAVTLVCDCLTVPSIHRYLSRPPEG